MCAGIASRRRRRPASPLCAGSDAGHAAEQHAAAAVRDFEEVARRPGSTCARPLRDIGASSGRPPRRRRHRLVGDADGAALDQVLRSARIRREMQIGEQQSGRGAASRARPPAAPSPSRSCRRWRTLRRRSRRSWRRRDDKRRRPCRCRARRGSRRSPRGRACAASRTLAGVMPTRYSWSLISLGTPMRIVDACLARARIGRLHGAPPINTPARELA